MGQEFIIKSQALEDKVNQLLPSQGGFQAGVDLSASTQIIPIVDLTESAEGSNLRQDLQTSLSLTSISAFNVSNTSTTIVNTTGYYRVIGTFNGLSNASSNNCQFQFTDGVTTKSLFIFELRSGESDGMFVMRNYDFIVFLAAGDSLVATSSSAQVSLAGATRQIADINGNLVNPL